MRTIAMGIAAVLFSTGASAAAQSGALDLFVGKADLDLSDVVGATFEPEGEEFGVRGRFGLPGSGLFFAGSYEQMKTDDQDVDVDVDEMHLGAGFRAAVAPAVDLSVEGQYVKFDLEVSSAVGSASDEFDGFGAYAALEGAVSSNVKVYGRLGYIAVEDDDDAELDGYDASAGIAFGMANNIGLFAEYRMARLETEDDESVDVDNARVGVRFGF